MARYTINYLTGDTETVEADGVKYDDEARDYTFYTGSEAVAFAPVDNVRSIHRHNEPVTG
ncbi:hypothetical protein [Streptomyces qinglanensis]|uniref:Uncharacterized protein n=1 Tax=Streptomyces qinglanensis TaxID=943816 RepID=A0A1H9U1S6_9ACTN|nr:hypothetical protein [Streptomyces qinglanensis]SES03550.1 hypothetical protein SAMN05421870_107247 [Streptomyces qinglanensis]